MINLKRAKMLVALALAVFMLVPAVCSAKTLETTRIELMNVAVGKPVYAPATEEGGKLTNGSRGDRLDPEFCNYTGADVTLPTGDVVPGAASAATDWYIIDLEEAYNLKEVRLYSRGDEPTTTDNWMGEFVIEVSNSILFPKDQTVNLGGIGATIEGTGVTSRETPFVAELDGSDAYRYIRIRKTAWTYFGWAELEAYVEVEVVDPYGNATFKEVSRNKPTEVNYGTYYDGETVGNWSPDKVVDGKFLDWQGWIMDGVSDRPAAPYNLLVDLEEDMPITKIEMFGRPNVPTEVNRNNWKVYGFTEAEGKPDISGEIVGGKELISVTTPFAQITDTVNPDADDGLSKIVDNSVPIRYLVFSKVKNEMGALSEIRAYVVVPEVLDAEMINASKLELKLSEAVDEATLDAGITVLVDGEKVIPSFDMGDDLSLAIDLKKEYFDAKIDVLVTEDLLNESGIGFLETEVSLFTPKALAVSAGFVNSLTESGTEISSISEALTSGKISAEVVVENNTKDEKTDVLVITALYNENNFIVASGEKRVTVDELSTETVYAGFTLPSEVTSQNADKYKVRAYVWKDYSLLKPWISRVTLGE